MDLDAYFDAELDEHEAVVAATRALKSDFIRLAEISEAAINGGNNCWKHAAERTLLCPMRSPSSGSTMTNRSAMSAIHR